MMNVTMDMLPEAHRKIAEVIGVEATLRLCEAYEGMALYIPMLDTIYAAVRTDMIRERYKGGEGIARLAREFKMSVRSVQRIVEDMPIPQIEGQIGLFDATHF